MKFFKANLECNCGYVTHYNGEFYRGKRLYVDRFCSSCGKHYLTTGHKFAKALLNYMNDNYYSYTGIAIDAGVSRITVLRWLNGTIKPAWKQRPNSVVVRYVHPSWEHCINLMHNGHRDFILECLDKGII